MDDSKRLQHDLRRWMSALGGAALLLAGCSSDGAGLSTPNLGELTLDPTVPPITEPDLMVGFDGGVPDGGRDAAVEERPGLPDPDEGPPADAPPGSSYLGCGGSHGWACPDNTVCCPASQECVPADCPDCCTSDDYHRFEDIDRMNPEQLPDVWLVGPPPGDDGRDGMPPRDVGDPDPGPRGPRPGVG